MTTVTPRTTPSKKNEIIFTSNNSIVVPRNNIGLKILQYARDEAHRFALNYNKKLRKKHLK